MIEGPNFLRFLSSVPAEDPTCGDEQDGRPGSQPGKIREQRGQACSFAELMHTVRDAMACDIRRFSKSAHF